MKKFDAESSQWWRELRALEIKDQEREGGDPPALNRCCALWSRVQMIQLFGRLHAVNHCPHCGQRLDR